MINLSAPINKNIPIECGSNGTHIVSISFMIDMGTRENETHFLSIIKYIESKKKSRIHLIMHRFLHVLYHVINKVTGA